MKFFLATFLFSISLCCLAQSESLDYMFDSQVFQKERTISVFLPATYNSEDSTEEFVVAYLFDSQFQPYFSIVSSIISYYNQTNEGIPMIIVGIHSENRWGEFVPVSKAAGSSSIESADKLSQFLTKEVIPLIDSTYRTKDLKVGIGHSLGATFVINEITKENSIFNAVIAVSPNLTIHNEQIIKQAEEFYKITSGKHRFVYTSVGTEGQMEQEFKQSLKHLDSITLAASPNNILWKCDILNGQNHMSTFVPAFNNGYLALSSKLVLTNEHLIKLADDPEFKIEDDLVNFHRQLSFFNGKPNTLTTEQIMGYAYQLSRSRRDLKSIELCQFALRLIEDEEFDPAEREKLEERINSRLNQSEFNLLAFEASEQAKSGDFKIASKSYIQAFEMNILKGTHFERMNAVPVLAQAGEIEQAFVQLDLLANKFKLGDNTKFIDNPLCAPLHGDPRWHELMDKFSKNAELYK